MQRSSMRTWDEAADQLAGSPTSLQQCSTAGIVAGSVGVVDGVMCLSKKSAGARE